MKRKGTHWTEELTEELRTRYAAGESMRDISIAIGITRNAVIGRLHRLGVVKHRPPRPLGRASPRPDLAISNRRRGPLRASKLSPLLGHWTSDKTNLSAPQRLMDDPSILAKPGLVHLVNLKPDQCRWPAWPNSRRQWDTDALFFCGAPADGGPYCAHHHARAFHPAGKVNTWHVPGA